METLADLHISTLKNLESLPDYLCYYVRHLSLDFRCRKSLFDLVAYVLPRLRHLTSLAMRDLRYPVGESRRLEFQQSWDAFLPCFDVAGTTSLKCLILDGVDFRGLYSFHHFLSKTRFRHLDELFIRDTRLIQSCWGNAYQEIGEQYPWDYRSSSLRTLTILRSWGSIYSALCDQRCPFDVTWICKLQFITSSSVQQPFHGLVLPKPSNVFKSLTHLETRGNEIIFDPALGPALPVLTHYYVKLSLYMDWELDERAVFPPFLAIHDAAPNLQCVILDVQDIPRGLAASGNKLNEIIVNAPLPLYIRFVVLVAKWTVDQVREALQMATQRRALEVVCAGAPTAFKMSHTNLDILQWIYDRSLEDVGVYFAFRRACAHETDSAV
ncbi:hypothetical protein VNI00_010521 [Paramarasmius palmivorus]|uniref:F-box domain-containing protein n=1 Tax=Paramarasmius palmivorus TaxID=297713 RepID=A0AAW0CIW7_9AGAR